MTAMLLSAAMIQRNAVHSPSTYGPSSWPTWYMIHVSIWLPNTSRKDANTIGTPAKTTRRKAIILSFTSPQIFGIWYALRKPSIQEIIAPDPVHNVMAATLIRNFRLTGLVPLKYCWTDALVPSGKIRPTAWPISRAKAVVVRDAERTEATRSTAGNKVKIAEKAAPLATAKASCWKARHNARRKCSKKRTIQGKARYHSATAVYTPSYEGATAIVAPYVTVRSLVSYSAASYSAASSSASFSPS